MGGDGAWKSELLLRDTMHKTQHKTSLSSELKCAQAWQRNGMQQNGLAERAMLG